MKQQLAKQQFLQLDEKTVEAFRSQGKSTLIKKNQPQKHGLFDNVQAYDH